MKDTQPYENEEREQPGYDAGEDQAEPVAFDDEETPVVVENSFAVVIRKIMGLLHR